MRGSEEEDENEEEEDGLRRGRFGFVVLSLHQTANEPAEILARAFSDATNCSCFC